MCGRYFFDPDDYMVFLEETKLKGRFKGGEVFPTADAPVLRANQEVLLARWGLPFSGSGQNLLHARSATVEEKRSFAPAFRHDRVMIPSSGFYEWQHKNGKSVPGEKYFFKIPDQKRLYMAGLLLPGPEGPCFVIITRKAGPSVETTHDREPLILPREKVMLWLRDLEAARRLLGTDYPELKRLYCGI